MRKDIKLPKVENVGVAVIQEQNEEKTALVYNVYLINFSDQKLTNLLISSKGYGINQANGESVKTSVLRHSLGTVEPGGFVKIEPIMDTVFGLNNEYWVSYYIDSKIFDKKYIFLPETIKEENLIKVPIINEKGVLIK
ncbi:hypothetical protein DNU06_12090 [Putridiphycobacter roseus]|uniref:Uncharacterized protein n=1 Tax=Putridiphycobacter roseus TaxID=2219161 RepID=A0A2W1MXN6_9FLAO|nr:hypothetical protein [Putridiphycobacter roseus]PZE16587.1 hypothetical protein DNU06_12090 [Putridiphycobacter roseus]